MGSTVHFSHCTYCCTNPINHWYYCIRSIQLQQDGNGNWRDICKPITADFRKQLNEAVAEGYGAAIEKMQATLEAARGMNDRPSLSGALKENAGKVKSQPVKAAAAKDGPSR